MQSLLPSRHRRANQQGLTLVELMVTMAISAIIGTAITAFFIGQLQHYSIGWMRGSMGASTQTALHRINDDVRGSVRVLISTPASGAGSDLYAPQPSGTWVSSDTQLVIAKIPRDTAGNKLSDTPDEIVYYLRDGNLYRRIIPYDNPSNANYPLVTCAGSQTPAGGCPSDTLIMDSIASIKFTYLDSTNNTPTVLTEATSIKTEVNRQAATAGQTIKINASNTMTLRSFKSYIPGSGTVIPAVPIFTPTPQTLPPLTIGPGGLSLSNTTVSGNGNAIIKGNLSVWLSNLSLPNNALNISNMGCGTPANYPQPCTTEPISIPFNQMGVQVTAKQICATGQYSTAAISGLQRPCTAPVGDLPSFDKQAFVNARNAQTKSAVSCNNGGSAIIEKDTVYTSTGTSSFSLCSEVPIEGSAYFKGNLDAWNTTFKVAEGIKTPPIIVVNGSIQFNGNNIKPNISDGVKPIFISFYSADPACSNSDSCNDFQGTRIYNSIINSSASAISLGGATMNAQFIAYYGSLYCSFNTIINGTVAAQKMLTISGSQINLTNEPWPAS
jgi:prepilin-type N-terminal cleavage/methylation domain-containing protein